MPKTNAKSSFATKGPFGGSIDATPFEIQPQVGATRSRIKSIVVNHSWAIGRIQVEYEDIGASPTHCYSVNHDGPVSGEQFQLEAGDYLTKVSGTWGRQAPNYPKEEIISLQFHTHNGKISKLFGGQSGVPEAEAFSLEAPAGQEIIGFWGTHGGRQDLLIQFGIYLQPTMGAVTEPIPSQNCLAFNGSNEGYIDTNLDAQPQTLPDTTWEAWVKPTGNPTGLAMFLSTDDEGWDRFICLHSQKFGISHGSQIWCPVAYDAGQWQHIAVVYTSSKEIKFYKNGVEYQYGAKSTIGTTQAKLCIGNKPNRSHPYQGLISEVRVWNCVRTPVEIRQNMHHRLKGDEPGLVGYWPLDEGSGDQALDKTRSGNNSMIHGVAWETTTDLNCMPLKRPAKSPESPATSTSDRDQTAPSTATPANTITTVKLPKLSPPVKRPHFIEPALAVDVEHGRVEDLVNIRMDLLHGANYNDPAAFAPFAYQRVMYSAHRGNSDRG